jgi:aldehyde dehydrogenase (NAD+)
MHPVADDTLVPNVDKFFIDGEWIKPSSSDMFDVVAPATEKPFFRVAEAREADIERAVAAARKAFDSGPWPLMRPQQRGAYLAAIADRLAEKTDGAGKVWSSEVGVVYRVSQYLMAGMPDVLRYYASLGDTYPFEERHAPALGEGHALLIREAVGVVAAIVPWNAPLSIALYKVAPALLAGCTVVLKASPEAPGELYLLAEAIREAGLPKGVFNIVTAGREVSEYLVRHASVDKVSFTGSSVAGRKIASICGERIARVTLELGGKSAAIICDDYDAGVAAQVIANSTSLASNQVCAALSRVIVSRSRHDEVVEALSATFRAIRVGDPFDPQTQMGPLAMARQRDRVEHYVATGLREGATLAAGGGRPSALECGYYVEPTVFANVDNSSTIAQEEIFGPVVTVIAAENEAQTVALANASIFGLGGSVFTHDADKAYQFARRLRTGTIGHNGFKADFSIAFGGFKQSGIGREGGKEGLMPYLETKTVILDAEPTSMSVDQGPR